AEAIAAADLSDAAKDLEMDALVIGADGDAATPPASARALASALRSSRLVMIDGAAHIPNFERAEQLTEAIRAFLAKSEGDLVAAGSAVRTAVLGEDYVSRKTKATTDLDRDFQRFITQVAWGSVWARPHFDRRLRSIVTIAVLAALGRDDELEL